MTNYADTAFGAVRGFLWDKLKEANILSAYEYIADGFTAPLVPIIPTQQVPEFNNLMGNKPYIIYDYDIASYDEQWWICEERLVFTIVASDFQKIIEITQFMIDLFRRMDETATDINAWQDLSTSKFKFFTFTLSGAQSPTPYEEEGGRQMGEVTVTYKYSRELDSHNRFM
jgi:hypothetical protein